MGMCRPAGPHHAFVRTRLLADSFSSLGSRSCAVELIHVINQPHILKLRTIPNNDPGNDSAVRQSVDCL